MTTVPPFTSPSTRDGSAGGGDGSGDADAVAEPVDQQLRTGSRPARSLWWKIGFPVAFVLLVLAIPVLVYVGLQVILDSTDGQLVRRVTDPAAPGYEAAVTPTPTDLVASTDAQGALDSITILTLTSDGIGGVMTVPASTVMPTTMGPLSLSFLYSRGGLDALSESLGAMLDLSFRDAQVVPSTDWAGLVGPAAPVAVTSPDPVVDAKGVVLFPQGTIQLTAEEVWPYISGRGARESDLNRMVRIQAFWEGWLTKLGASGPGAIPIPTDAGLGRFLAALADDRVQYQTLPVTPTAPTPTGGEQFAVADSASAAVAAFIPFPEGPPGTRPRLRVLDGTGQLDNGVSAAIVLAAAGGQVDVVGNARSFGAPTTEFVYYDPAMEAEARRLRDALGIGEVVQSDQTNSATDLTVVLGEDYLAVVGSDPSTAAQPDTLEADDG